MRIIIAFILFILSILSYSIISQGDPIKYLEIITGMILFLAIYNYLGDEND